MDATYYRNNLSFLYESSDPQRSPPVYGTDPVLLAYTNADTFVNQLSVAAALRPVQRAEVLREATSDVTARAALLFVGGPQATTSSSPLPTSTTFSDEERENDVRLRIDRPAAGTITLDAATASIASEVQTQSFRGESSETHQAAQTYMRGVVMAIGGLQFKAAMDRLATPAVESAPESLRDAAFAISRGFSARRKDMLFTVLADNCRVALDKYIVEQLTNLPATLLADLNDGGFASPFYYRLRVEAARELVVPSALAPMGADDYTLSYFKRLLVDLYVRTCYPLIHYDFLDVMMQRYVRNGDFVNARVALLSKIMFVNHFLDAVVMATTASTGGSIVNPQIPPVIDGIKTTLNNYLTTLNTTFADRVLDGTQTKDPRVAILRRLQNISSDAVRQNQRAEAVHGSVVQHQVTLQNITANAATLASVKARRTTVFWTTAAALFAVLAASAVLLALGKPQFATYLASAWILLLSTAALVDVLRGR